MVSNRPGFSQEMGNPRGPTLGQRPFQIYQKLSNPTTPTIKVTDFSFLSPGYKSVDREIGSALGSQGDARSSAARSFQ